MFAGNPAKWLVVFDFDKTIMRLHMWGTYQDAPLDAVPSDDPDAFVDLPALREFVNTAREHHAVAIATFGRRDVADKAMRSVFGEEHGIVISTPSDHPDPMYSDSKMAPRCPEGSAILGNKNTQLFALAELHQVESDRIILIDDDERNVEGAREAGMMGLHSPDGLSSEILSRAWRLIGTS